MPGTAPDPKIELHVHLEGTVRPDTLRAIAKRNDYALPDDLESLYRFRDFAHFIEVFELCAHALRTYDDFRQVVLDYAAEAKEHGAVYLEGIFAPGLWRELDTDEVFSGYCDGAEEARELHGVEVRLTPDIPRVYPLEDALTTARFAVKYRDRGVVGIGLGGPEEGHPPEPYADAFALARNGGLASVPHAGEAVGAESVRGALDALVADRIRHGIRSVEDPGLVAELAGRGTVLDVCPLSNLRTGVVALARGAPAAATRRRRRPLLDLDRRPGDVRHRPDPRLRGGRFARRLAARRVRGRARRCALRRRNSRPPASDRRLP